MVGAARALAEKERINAIRATARRDPARRKPILTILAPQRIDDKIEERRSHARRRPALKSGREVRLYGFRGTEYPPQRKRKP